MNFGPIEIDGTFLVHQAYKKKEVELIPNTNYDFIKFFVPFDDWVESNLLDLQSGNKPHPAKIIIQQEECKLGEEFEKKLDSMMTDKESHKSEREKEIDRILNMRRQT